MSIDPNAQHERFHVTYQAYLDAIEKQTGRTPQQLLDEAARRGYGPGTTATSS